MLQRNTKRGRSVMFGMELMIFNWEVKRSEQEGEDLKEGSV